MNWLRSNHVKIPMLALITFFSAVIFNGPANAGDYSMEANCNDMAELMTKWSKQLSSAKLTPEAQEKLSELLLVTSQVLRDLATKSGDDMNAEHFNMIKKMEAEWDPFDTYGGN